MTTDNPYRAPESLSSRPDLSQCYREGKYVFVPKGQDLPPRCIICNAEADLPIKKRTMYWHSPGYYLIILLNIILYALVAMFARSKAKVSPGYCKVHKAARRKRIALFMVPSILLLVGGFIAAATADSIMGALALIVSVLLMVISAIANRILVPVRIDKTGAKYSGCKEPFLSSLPNDL